MINALELLFLQMRFLMGEIVKNIKFLAIQYILTWYTPYTNNTVVSGQLIFDILMLNTNCSYLTHDA